jgi:hypothetical protein
MRILSARVISSQQGGIGGDVAFASYTVEPLVSETCSTGHDRQADPVQRPQDPEPDLDCQ